MRVTSNGIASMQGTELCLDGFDGFDGDSGQEMTTLNFWTIATVKGSYQLAFCSCVAVYHDQLIVPSSSMLLLVLSFRIKRLEPVEEHSQYRGFVSGLNKIQRIERLKCRFLDCRTLVETSTVDNFLFELH